MNAPFLDAAVMLAVVGLVAATACALARLLRGPSLLDRVVALDVIAVLVVGFTIVTAIHMEQPALVDAALVIALVAFVGTIAFARFIEEGQYDD